MLCAAAAAGAPYSNKDSNDYKVINKDSNKDSNKDNDEESILSPSSYKG